MPVTRGVGFSDRSQAKEEAYYRLLFYHCKIACNVIKRYRWMDYRYNLIDANAGAGLVPGVESGGSPLVALRVLAQLGLMEAIEMPPFALHLVEHRRENADALGNVIRGLYPHFDSACSCQVHIRDNASAVPDLANLCGKKATGLIYQDSTTLPNWEMLGKANKCAPLLDQMVWVNSIGIKRSRIHGKPTLMQGMMMTGKKRWLVLAPDENRWQFSFVLGTNAPTTTFKDWPTVHWYRAESSAGARILEQLEYTVGERKEIARELELERTDDDGTSDIDTDQPAGRAS